MRLFISGMVSLQMRINFFLSALYAQAVGEKIQGAGWEEVTELAKEQIEVV